LVLLDLLIVKKIIFTLLSNLKIKLEFV